MPAIGLTLLVGIVSGLYPAFFLSRFQPAQVLKANRSAAETPGSGRLRTALVVLQFAVSIGLIICTAVIYGQTVYARTSIPATSATTSCRSRNWAAPSCCRKAEMIVEQMKRMPGVVAVGADRHRRQHRQQQQHRHHPAGQQPAGHHRPV